MAAHLLERVSTFGWLRIVTYCLLPLATSSYLLAADRPNIVFIYTDDQAAWALGHAEDNQAQALDIQTPNLDRLCREGAYFTNAFVTTPVCSPARATLMTSRYGTELGITDWINHREEPDLGLDPSLVTWPEVLAATGYTGGLFGKWHLGTLDKFHPTQAGFDRFYGFRGGATELKDPILEVDGKLSPQEGLLTDLLTNEAIRFIGDNRDQPFFACVHYRAPHKPWLPVADEDWAPFKSIDPQIPNPGFPDLDTGRVKKNMREYLASVASIDRNVGRLLSAIDTMKLRERTVVIFTSDHGYNIGHHGIMYKGNAYWILKNNRQPRSNLFDTSIRVPMAVRWPGTIDAGTVIERTITNLDWYPTLVAMAGAQLPKDETIRGRSFLPLLQRKEIPWSDDSYGEYSQKHGNQTHLRMVRTPEWKLIRDFKNAGKDELYHLARDPGETVNLIDSIEPAVRQVRMDLDVKIRTKMRELNDPVLKIANHE